MKCYKKIISFSLAFAILFSSVPAFATDISTEDSHTFWGWMAHNAERGAHWLEWPLVGNLIHDLAAGGSEYVCPASSDGWHHASDFDSIETNSAGTYYLCTCSDCHDQFRVYEEDVGRLYDQAVSELPASTITSDGGLIWFPRTSDFSSLLVYNPTKSVASSNTLVGDCSYSDTDFILHDDCVECISTKSSFSFNYFGLSFASILVAPISGTYIMLPSEYSSYSYTKNGVVYSASDNWNLLSESQDILVGDNVHFTPSNFSPSQNKLNLGSVSYVHGYCYYPAFRIIPDNALDIDSGDTYNIDNRVGSLVGNYTYEGDNGTQIIAEDIRIVNETDQSVYNPVTNETYYYNEYTYNYGDRSYDFSFGDRDDHVSVTYGDDCVTIEDGDRTYTIYYTTASNHEHSYRITNVIDPTCTEQGKIYKTCSECGDELIEFTDAFGHDWQITEQTAVDYVLPEARCPACESQYFTYELADEVFYCICQDCGEEWNCNADVTEGHTTYTCSRCGEERTETNQEQDLSLFEAIGDLLADTFEWITDKLGQFINSLSGLSESFSSRIESIIESVGNYPLLFGAFLAGMPDDLMNIVWFGVIALVFVLVWKKFFS